MTTVQAEKIARWKLSLLELAQEMGHALKGRTRGPIPQPRLLLGLVTTDPLVHRTTTHPQRPAPSAGA